MCEDPLLFPPFFLCFVLQSALTSRRHILCLTISHRMTNVLDRLQHWQHSCTGGELTREAGARSEAGRKTLQYNGFATVGKCPPPRDTYLMPIWQ